MHKGHIVTGTITGTGAAINVQLGFVPQHVRVLNETKVETIEWFNTMVAGGGRKTAATGAQTALTTDGVTAYAGSAGSAGAGFTLGTNSNAAADVIRYFAFSSDS